MEAKSEQTSPHHGKYYQELLELLDQGKKSINDLLGPDDMICDREKVETILTYSLEKRIAHAIWNLADILAEIANARGYGKNYLADKGRFYTQLRANENRIYFNLGALEKGSYKEIQALYSGNPSCMPEITTAQIQAMAEAYLQFLKQMFQYEKINDFLWWLSKPWKKALMSVTENLSEKLKSYSEKLKSYKENEAQDDDQSETESVNCNQESADPDMVNNNRELEDLTNAYLFYSILGLENAYAPRLISWFHGWAETAESWKKSIKETVGIKSDDYVDETQKTKRENTAPEDDIQSESESESESVNCNQGSADQSNNLGDIDYDDMPELSVSIVDNKVPQPEVDLTKYYEENGIFDTYLKQREKAYFFYDLLDTFIESICMKFGFTYETQKTKREEHIDYLKICIKDGHNAKDLVDTIIYDLKKPVVEKVFREILCTLLQDLFSIREINTIPHPSYGI